MNSRKSSIFLLAAAIAALASAAFGQVAADQVAADQVEGQGPKVERARVVGTPGHRDTREIRVVIRDAGRLDWLQRDDLLAFDRPNDDGFYDIFIAQADGSVDRCLTCENFVFHKMHVLDPVWHPSGEYLVVQVQEAAKRLKQDIAIMATPLRGVHSELWAISADGRGTWQLTQVLERGGAVLGAAFSHEGGQILWRERVSTRGGRPYGEWATRLAEWSRRRGTPRLGKSRLIDGQSYGGLELAQEFTPDDRGLLLSGLPSGQGEHGLDVIRLDLASGGREILTATPAERDDLARTSPDGRFIVWASSLGIESLAPDARRLPWRSDLWMMRADGSEQQRLTFWNDAESDHHLGETMITDLVWSPEGDRLLATVVSVGIEVEQAIWAVVLDASYGRVP